jgi:MFS family permease
MVLMPVFAGEILHGGPHTLGLLMASNGVGALAGVLWLASRSSVLGLGRVIVGSGVAFGAALIAFALSRSVWLMAPLLAVAGAGIMVEMAASNTLVQTLVDEDKRGRVMSFYTMAFFGMAPFGSLASGLLGARLGAPATVVIGGLLTLGAAALFARQLPGMRVLVRPIYARLGILPEVASGLEQAASVASPPDH